MATITVNDSDPKQIVVSFRYHKDMVEDIKTISGRRYLPDAKSWAIPRTSERDLHRFIARWGGSAPQTPVLPPTQDEATVYPTCTKTPPWGHQLAGLRYMWNKPAALLDLTMASGKSKIVVDYVLNKPGVRRVLIVCPKSVVPVWALQFGRHGGKPVLCAELDERAGSVEHKAHAAARTIVAAKSRDMIAVVVVNYDSVWREPFRSWALDAKLDLLVLDEIQRVKGRSSNVGRFAYQLGRAVPVKVGLSGTPFSHSPLDAYGVYRALDPSIFGTNYRQFEQTYALMGGFGNYKVLKFINQSMMQEKLGRIRFHVEPEGYDLPDAVHTDIPVTLSDEHRRLYRQLENNFYAKVGSGEITAANAAVSLIRLSQLTSGYLPAEYESEEDEYRTDVRLETLHTLKQDALQDLLEDLPEDEPVVCFCRFRYDLEQIHRAAKAAGRTSLELSGKRHELERWQQGETTVLAAQLRAGSVGVDLTRAAYAIYVSYSYSLEEFEQSLARIRRPGQKRTCKYYHIIAEKSVDDRIRKALASRKAVLDALLEVPRGD